MGFVDRRISIPSIQVSLTLTLESGSSASGASRACALQNIPFSISRSVKVGSVVSLESGSRACAQLFLY